MSVHQFNGIVWLWAVLICVGLAGCGGASRPVKGAVTKAQVSGTVTMGGQPLEGAEVYFFTDKFTGFAKTDAQGKYRLAQGAAVGNNKVYISKIEGGSDATTPASDPVATLNDPGQAAAAAAGSTGTFRMPKQLVPTEYSSQTSSKLTFEVLVSGAKDADFNL